jgi:heme exporter protein D
MIWNNWKEFVAMGGYAPYVWGSVVVVLGAVACEVASLRLRRRAALSALAQEAEAVRVRVRARNKP